LGEPRLRAILSRVTGLDDRAQHQGAILVVGLGRFGSAVAATLTQMGHEVLAIDTDGERVTEHSEVVTHAALADSTSERVLRQLGVPELNTAIVCIGNDIEASVLTTAALVDLGVSNVWAKAITESHGRILERVGASHVVFPEAEMGGRVAHLVTGSMIEYIALDEDFVLIETRAPMVIVGRPLVETGLRANFKVTVVCVKPEGGAFTYANFDTVLGPNDLIVVAGHRDDIARFVAA
jgi:trk system potassium uptake protein TrkA